MSTVAICIPTYNQADYIEQAIESAFAQTFRDVEVWVADDCSTDATPRKLRELSIRYPQLHTHTQASNMGISANNNWLLSQPTTDFIVRLDSDDILEPLYVEKLVALMEQNSTAAYAHCAVREIDKHKNQRRIRRLGGRSEFQDPDAALRASASGYRVAANICLFRSSALRSLGYYRRGMNFAEDWDLSARLAEAGWANVYCSEILANYRVWEDVGQVRPRRTQIEIEGCIQVFEKVLLPAWEKKGWDDKFLKKKRKAMALRYGVVLDSALFTPAERRQLFELLIVLGDSLPLRLQTFLLSIKLGPLIRWQKKMVVVLKDKTKSVIRR